MVIGVILVALIGSICLLGFVFATKFALGSNLLARRFNNQPFYRNERPTKGEMRSWGVMGAGMGQITKVEDNTLTIQRPNGQTYTLTLKDDAVINKSVKGGKDDLKTGENIMVFGNGMFGPQTIWIAP